MLYSKEKKNFTRLKIKTISNERERGRESDQKIKGETRDERERCDFSPLFLYFVSTTLKFLWCDSYVLVRAFISY